MALEFQFWHNLWYGDKAFKEVFAEMYGVATVHETLVGNLFSPVATHNEMSCLSKQLVIGRLKPTKNS